MKLAIPKGGGEFYTFTNEDLKIGDKVFPLVHGWSHNGEWYLTDIAVWHDEDPENILACTGWSEKEEEREYHTIKDIVKYPNEPLRIITDRGYSPAQCYFKEIKQ